MTRTQNVGRPTYAQEIPGHLQETNQPQPVFSDQELDTYFDTIENPSTTISAGISTNQLISRERLKRYLNIIETTDAGRNILTTLKILMNGKKICIVESDTASEVRNLLKKKLKYISDSNVSLKFLQNIPNLLTSSEKIILFFQPEKIYYYLLQKIDTLDKETLMVIVESFIKSGDDELIDIGMILKDNSQVYEFKFEENIILINQDLLAKERLAFDGENIVSIDLERMLGSKEAVEAYFFAHELVHYIQFLSNENNIMGGKEDKDWESFLQTPRMKNIYDALKEKYSEEEIYKAFKVLFQNVEEARNLLGFVPDGLEQQVGEFFWFNKKNNYCLPVYLDMDGLSKAQKDTCKTVLKTIANAEEFKISLQNVSMTSEARECVEYNSNNFRNYANIEEKMMDDI